MCFWKQLSSKVDVSYCWVGKKNAFCLMLLSGSSSTLLGSWMSLLCVHVLSVWRLRKNTLTVEILICKHTLKNTQRWHSFWDLCPCFCMFLACAAACLLRSGFRFQVCFPLNKQIKYSNCLPKQYIVEPQAMSLSHLLGVWFSYLKRHLK